MNDSESDQLLNLVFRSGGTQVEFEAIIERDIECVFPDGSCRMVRLRIGRPYLEPDKDWCCPVAMDGWYGKFPPIHGVDSWQAFLLALRLLEELLAAEVEHGVVLHWPAEEGETIDIAELFSRAERSESSADFSEEQTGDEV